MQNLLRDLRSIVEHERTVYGTLLPLNDAETHSARNSEASPDSEEPATQPNEETLTAADDETPAAAGDSPTDGPARETAPPSADDNTEDAAESPGNQTTTSSTPTSPPDDASSDPMPNKDLFGNRTRPPEEDPTLPPWKRIDALVPDDAPYKDAETLEAVEEYLANTVLVPIDEDRENPVFGVGDPHADLVIIGEAPGRDEDKEGEPFVGRAGTLLDKILDAINFTREEVYITNILKSRPPRNRDPHQEEVEAHLPILYKQLALIRPEIILAVGKVAGNTLLDRSSSLSNLRDKEHDFYGTPLMVTYHPAALLRNSQWKRPTWEDVKLLRTRYDELTADE
jgi:DNA polymerase